jgi:hypothetical protein
MGIPYVQLDNNDIWAGLDNLSRYDSMLSIDDGFGIGELKNIPSRNAYYAVDVHNNPEKHYIPHIGQFSKIYCAQNELGVKLLKSYSVESEWLPLAYDTIGWGYYPEKRTEWKRDVAYVASWSTQRRIEMRDLVKNMGGFTEISFRDEMAREFRASKVCLNDFGRQTSGKTCGDHINARTFEVMGTGAMLLTARPEIPDLDLMGFKDGVHLVLWDDVKDCMEKLDYYIKHDDEREAIAYAGQQKVLAEHTYKQRCEKILGNMGVWHE